MATNTHIHRFGTLVAAASAAALAFSAAAISAPDVGNPPTCSTRTAILSRAGKSLSTVRFLSTRPRSYTYDWPVKPFDRPHPVRGFFDDPRIGKHGSHAFHFGVDVAAPDGTPVYAVEPGEVWFDSGRAVAVVAPDKSHSFGYWHIVPAVKPHQLVRRHQLLGYVEQGWGHVHFAERRGGNYVNPLRPGGLGPYADATAPTIAEISLQPSAHGQVALIANAYDMPPLRVPGPWADEPVTPVLIQWQLVRVGQTGGAWRSAADFRSHMLDRDDFHSVYAPGTRQNHEGRSGLYCFYLDRGWQPTDGRYRLSVRAVDTYGNRAEASFEFVVRGDVQQ